VIKQDILESQVNTVYLGIGSNLGNRIKNIEKAKSYLIQNNVKIISVSSYYETPSWPNPKNPKFLNIVLKIKCSTDATSLLNLCKIIELKLGRKKTVKNSPRECDIDIIDFNGLATSVNYRKNEIILPHKRMHTRNFVLLPLYEINKGWYHPKIKKNIVNLMSNLPILDFTSIKLI